MWFQRQQIDIGLELRHRLIALGMEPSPFTPDIAKLEKYQQQLLFVPDEWMRDRRSHFVVEDDSKHQFTGFTKDHFKFLVHNGTIGDERHDALPILHRREEGGLKIKGEVISLPPSAFLKLDKLKMNRFKYIRRRVWILYPNRNWGVFENRCEDTAAHGTMGCLHWTGRIPCDQKHPLAGKKYWTGKERVDLVQTWMYVAHPKWLAAAQRNPEQFDEVKRFEPKKDKRWLSSYYKYQHPKE